MLEAWIIEELKRREEEVQEQPRIECPVPEGLPLPKDTEVVESDRGVITIDISTGEPYEETED